MVNKNSAWNRRADHPATEIPFRAVDLVAMPTRRLAVATGTHNGQEDLT